MLATVGTIGGVTYLATRGGKKDIKEESFGAKTKEEVGHDLAFSHNSY